MKNAPPIGLGEPELVGKKSLFQPPDNGQRKPELPLNMTKDTQVEPLYRVRTTIGLTSQALQILQDIQHRHRLATGKVLPLWKLVSQVIESYGKTTDNKNHKNEQSQDELSMDGPGKKPASRASLAQT